MITANAANLKLKKYLLANSSRKKHNHQVESINFDAKKAYACLNETEAKTDADQLNYLYSLPTGLSPIEEFKIQKPPIFNQCNDCTTSLDELKDEPSTGYKYNHVININSG